jgi:hypothetical protein
MEITKIITESIQKENAISFLKYGDGEYICATTSNYNAANCDMDFYSENKKNKLIEAFKFMVDKRPNTFIGLWHNSSFSDYWQSLVDKKINFAKYHTLIMDNNNIDEKVLLYKTIKLSKMKKIYVCNPLLVKAKILFNIDYMVHVPFNNWFDNHFFDVLENIKNIINNEDENTKFIIMTSAGMSAKILIYELSQKFPNNIYLDFGSANDKICTKKTSRGWEPDYETFIELLKDIIPNDWNDPSYDYIYDEAKGKLGVHL